MRPWSVAGFSQRDRVERSGASARMSRREVGSQSEMPIALCDSLVRARWPRSSAGALPFLADRLDFCVAAKDGLAVGPRKRRSKLAGAADYRAPRRLIAQVRPLQVEGVAVLHPDASQRVGGGPPERRFRTFVAIDVEEGDLFARQDHGLVT